MEVGTRIQIALDNTLVAEAIVSDYMAAVRLWSAYSNLKYLRGLPSGCSVMNRADLTRLWDVPVGSLIKETK
jgi:hypothetical protein